MACRDVFETRPSRPNSQAARNSRAIGANAVWSISNLDVVSMNGTAIFDSKTLTSYVTVGPATLISFASSTAVSIGAHLPTKKNLRRVALVMRKSNTVTGPRFLRITRFRPKLIAGLWILVLVASMVCWLVALVWIAYLLIRRML
jgi:hypothetical protein